MPKIETSSECMLCGLSPLKNIAQRCSLVAFRTILLEVAFGLASKISASYLTEEIIEYEKSSARVGNIPISPPEEQYGQRSTPFVDIFSDLLGKAPMVRRRIIILREADHSW